MTSLELIPVMKNIGRETTPKMTAIMRKERASYPLPPAPGPAKKSSIGMVTALRRSCATVDPWERIQLRVRRSSVSVVITPAMEP